MESIISFFSGTGLNISSFLRLSCILLVGSLLISSINRFIFRKKTLLSYALSSSVAIIFIYIVTVLILVLAPDWRFLVTPLPFVEMNLESVSFFHFEGTSFQIIAQQLLGMMILAFLINTLDGLLPRSKHLLKWVLSRSFTVALGFILHFIVTYLSQKYLPEGILMYAPVILMILLLLMLLTGALRIPLGLLLATVNPLIAGLYTFFFANIIGKQITKAALTTAAISGVIVLLQRLEITVLSLSSEAMIGYIPFLLILVILWYILDLI